MKNKPDDNLMRSKTYGRQLNDQQIRLARTAAYDIAFTDINRRQCSPPRIGPGEYPAAWFNNKSSAGD